MSRFMQMKEILDAAVGGPTAPVSGPHGPFWRTLTRDQFVAFEVFGLPLVSLGTVAAPSSSRRCAERILLDRTPATRVGSSGACPQGGHLVGG
jgi:hypothetical protein